MFWRAWLLGVAVVLLINIAAGMLAVWELPKFLLYKPALAGVIFAAVLIVGLFARRCGFLQILWGARLSLSPHFWRTFTWSFAAMLCVLAVINAAAATLLPLQQWNLFKLTVPSVVNLLFFAVVPNRLAALQQAVPPDGPASASLRQARG